MPNPIKYNVSAESLALKRGNFWIGTGDVQKSPTSTTGFYNGITPPTNGYTIYQNKASDGPSIYVANNDTDLIYFTNHITNGSYTTVNQCLTYFATQTDKMVFNRDYESIITNGLVLNLDAGFTGSYARSGSTWNDLSVSGNSGSLINGPTFDSSNSGSLVFDGVDEYVQISGFNGLPIGSSQRSVNVWFNPQTTTWADNVNNLFFYGTANVNGATFGIDFGTYPKMEVYTWGGVGRDLVFNTTFPQTGWSNITATYDGNLSIKIYENGTQTQTLTLSSPCNTGSSNVWIGNIDPAVQTWCYLGKISFVQIYNRELSATEVLQNYNSLKTRYGL